MTYLAYQFKQCVEQCAQQEQEDGGWEDVTALMFSPQTSDIGRSNELETVRGLG